MRRLLVLVLMLPLVALAVTSPPPTHIWAEDTSAGSIPNVPATREWTIVRVDTMTSYIHYLFEHQQALVLPMGDMYYLYWAYNDGYSHVRTIVFGETQFMDPASWVVQDLLEWGVLALGYIAPSAYFDGSLWYPEVTYNTYSHPTTEYVLDEGGLMAGLWSDPYDLLDGRQFDYYLPLTWAGTDNVVYMDGQARDIAGDSHYFQSFAGWTGEMIDPPGEVLIFPSEPQYGPNPVYGQGYENSQLMAQMDVTRADRVVIALGGYRGADIGPDFVDNPLTIAYKESYDGGMTWGDCIWVDQDLVADMPGGDPGIQGHYSNSFFDMLLDEDGDIHFAAVLVDSGYDGNESEVFGIYDIHQNDGAWTATLISDGVYAEGEFDPGEQYLDGDSWMHSPSLSLAPDGRIIACWNDIGWNDPVDSLVSIDIWVSGSANGGANWTEPMLITETEEVDEYFSRLITYCTNENAYIVTMYDGTSGPMDCIRVPLVDISCGASGLPVPQVTALGNVSPNPFTDEVAVNLSLPSAGIVDARVYNVKGELVQTILRGRMDRGEHRLVFDGREASAGIYFCRVDVDRKTMSRKMILVR